MYECGAGAVLKAEAMTTTLNLEVDRRGNDNETRWDHGDG